MSDVAAQSSVRDPATILPRTRWFVANYYALAALAGVRNLTFWEFSLADYLLPLTASVLLGGWAVTDSRRRGRPIPLLSRKWFVIFAAVLVPAYLIGTRRWRGLGWVLLHGVGWWVVTILTMLAVGSMAYGPPW